MKQVMEFAEANGVSRIDTLVLQIGELSPMIPKYVEECFPAAVDGTIMEGTKLRIEVLPGNASCRGCGAVFNVIKNEGACPDCGKKDFDLLGGREFTIKEIVAC